MGRFVVLVIDSCGAGELPDAAAYGDAGSNTLANCARRVGGLELPKLGPRQHYRNYRLPCCRQAARRSRPDVGAVGGQGHHDRPLGDDGDRPAEGLHHLPQRLSSRADAGMDQALRRARLAREQARQRHRDPRRAGRGAPAHGIAHRLHQRRQRFPNCRKRSARAFANFVQMVRGGADRRQAVRDCARHRAAVRRLGERAVQAHVQPPRLLSRHRA